MTQAYAGVWRLARTIVDEESANILTCTGTATLRPCTGSATLRTDAGTIDYGETVSFLLAKKVMRATRAYRFTSSNGTIVANFADGKPFFALTLNADGTGTAVHQCRDDWYTLSLALTEPSAWRTRWDVTGAKRLIITTHYTRVGEAFGAYTSTIAP